MHRVVILCVAAFGLLMVVEMVCRSIDRPANGIMLTSDMIQVVACKSKVTRVDAEAGNVTDQCASTTPIHGPHEATVPNEPLWQKIKGGVGISGVPAFVPRNDQGGVAGSCSGGSFSGGVCGNLGAFGGTGEQTQQRSIDNSQKVYKSGS